MLESREQFFESLKHFIQTLQKSKSMYEKLSPQELPDYAQKGIELANCTDGLFEKLTVLGNESFYDAAIKSMKILGDVVDKFFLVFNMPPIPDGSRLAKDQNATPTKEVLEKLMDDKPFVIHCYTMFSLVELAMQEFRVKNEKNVTIDQSMVDYMDPFAKQLRKVPDFILRALDLDALQGIDDKVLRDEMTAYHSYYRSVFKKFIDKSLPKPSEYIGDLHQKLDELDALLDGMDVDGTLDEDIEKQMQQFADLKNALLSIPLLADYFERQVGAKKDDPTIRITYELNAYAIINYLAETDGVTVLRDKISQLQHKHQHAKGDVLACDFEALMKCVANEKELYTNMLAKLTPEALMKIEISEARETQTELLARQEYTQWLVAMHQKHYPEQAYLEKLQANSDLIIKLMANIAKVANRQSNESVTDFWLHIVKDSSAVSQIFGVDENFEHVLSLLKNCHQLLSGDKALSIDNFDTLMQSLSQPGFKEFKERLASFKRLKQLQQIIKPKKIGRKGYMTKPTLEQLKEYVEGVGLPGNIDLERVYKEQQERLTQELDLYVQTVLSDIQQRIFNSLNSRLKKYLTDFERSKRDNGYVHIDESLQSCQILAGLWGQASKNVEQHIVSQQQYQTIDSAVKHVDQYLEENTTWLMYLLDMLAWLIGTPNAKLPNTVRHIRLGRELKEGLNLLEEHMKKTIDTEKEMSVEDKEKFSKVAKEALDEFRYNLRAQAVKVCRFGLFGYGSDSEEGLHKVLDKCKLSVSAAV